MVQECDGGVCECGAVLSGVQLVGEGIEGVGVLPEVADVEDGFSVGEVQALQVGVETGSGRAEVGDAGGGGYACAGLSFRHVRMAEMEGLGKGNETDHDYDFLCASRGDVLCYCLHCA